jgi:hypothetical protein
LRDLQVQYVEAPTEYTGTLPGVFLAGGITDCPNWQAEACAQLADAAVAVLNPRRADFPILDPSAAAETQITWEFHHLRRADVVLFWFPGGPAIQPIALYELGFHANDPAKRIAVGCDPAYRRRTDVLHQLRLIRPTLRVHDALSQTCTEALTLAGL